MEASIRAYDSFKQGDLAKCLTELQKAKANKASALLSHNLLIAEYYASKCANPLALLRKLEELRTQTQESELTNAMLFNLGLLNFQCQQYGKAMKHLAPLHKKIDNVEELLAVKSELLWVQTHFALGRHADAREALLWLETQVTKSTAVAQDGEEAKVPMDTGAQKSLFLGGSPEESMKNSRCINAKEFKLAVCLLRTQLLLATQGNARSTSDLLSEMRTLKGEIDVSHFPEQSVGWLRAHYEEAVGMLAAQAEYLTGNPANALRIVTQTEQSVQGLLGSRMCHPSCQPAAGAKIAYPALYYNSLGCIHMKLKKPKLALMYFSKAYETITSPSHIEDDAVARPTEAVTFYASQRRCESLFNMGLALLASNLPAQALDCLLECSGLLKGNARYWYRLAQCYVMQHMQALQEAQQAYLSDLCVSQSNGVYRLPAKAVFSFEEEEGKAQKPDLLEQAIKSLRNALFLLSDDDELKTHVLLLLAYSCLTREPQSSLKYLAQLSSAELTQSMKFSVSLYTAEAWAQIGKMKQASDQIATATLPRDAKISCHSTLCPKAMVVYDDMNWKVAQCVNAASVLISSGNIPQAQTHLNNAANYIPAGHPLPGPLLHLYIYLALKAGNHKQAAEILQTRMAPVQNRRES